MVGKFELALDFELLELPNLEYSSYQFERSLGISEYFIFGGNETNSFLNSMKCFNQSKQMLTYFPKFWLTRVGAKDTCMWAKILLVMDTFATCFVIFRHNPERYKHQLFM